MSASDVRPPYRVAHTPPEPLTRQEEAYYDALQQELQPFFQQTVAALRYLASIGAATFFV